MQRVQRMLQIPIQKIAASALNTDPLPIVGKLTAFYPFLKRLSRKNCIAVTRCANSSRVPAHYASSAKKVGQRLFIANI
jgi:hypothetical protein